MYTYACARTCVHVRRSRRPQWETVPFSNSLLLARAPARPYARKRIGQAEINRGSSPGGGEEPEGGVRRNMGPTNHSYHFSRYRGTWNATDAFLFRTDPCADFKRYGASDKKIWGCEIRARCRAFSVSEKLAFSFSSPSVRSLLLPGSNFYIGHYARCPQA